MRCIETKCEWISEDVFCVIYVKCSERLSDAVGAWRLDGSRHRCEAIDYNCE
jgi:hypothetical protein